MRIIKLDTFLDDNDFSGENGEPDRLPYQVVASCRRDEAAHIKELMLLQLQEGFDQGYALEIKSRTDQVLIDFTVSLACSTTERAALVRLVNQLGLEKRVRSVRWESVPAMRA